MLPEKFKARMMDLLGDEFDSFLRSMSEEPVRAFRVNTVKVSVPERIGKKLGIEPLSYEPYAYTLDSEIRIGRTHEHHSGAIYVQDPGAMAALAAIDIPENARVADLCAAPGGKSTQIARHLGKDGFILSNEFVPKRAKLLVGNFERLGIRNAIVTSLDTSEMPKLFDGVFDLVVVDAPCSGEGMFRKNAEAIAEWSEENVHMCAQRQREILNNAAPLVATGGTLLYSTCTFSTEENEECVTDFLDTHPDFRLKNVHERIIPYTAPGIDVSGRYPQITTAARRFYPHVSRGEGQFVALLEKLDTGSDTGSFKYKDAALPPSKEETRITEEFFASALSERPSGRLAKIGDNIVLISHGCPLPPKSVFLSGVLVGEIRKGMLFPSHQMFSAYGKLFKNKIDLTPEDSRLESYLRGEEIPVDKELKGWCTVLADGVTLGGAKASGGVLKNHYPKGLRNN